MRLALPISVLLLSLAPPAAVAQYAVGPSMWRAEARDNICGVSNPRHVTNPALVDYNEVLRATPEMKDLKSRDIDLRSAEGQILRQRAGDHVRRVGSKVMHETGDCGLWKAVSRRDGRVVRDSTDQVVVAIQSAFHWPASLHGTERGQGGPLGCLGFFATEGAAHASNFDSDCVSGATEHASHGNLNLGWMLCRAMNVDVSIFHRQGQRDLAFKVKMVLATDAKRSLGALGGGRQRSLPVTAGHFLALAEFGAGRHGLIHGYNLPPIPI